MRASLDSTRLFIGDRFRLQLEAVLPTNGRLESIDLSALKEVENVDIEAETDWDTTQLDQQQQLKKTLTLQVWDSGYYRLPPVPFVFKENNRQRVLETNELAIQVVPVVLQDSTELAAIKDILRERATVWDYLPFILAFSLVPMAALLFHWWRKRQQTDDTYLPPLVQRPAHEIALDALRDLRANKLWQQGNFKEYQSQLTYIIRQYLENRYGVPALESTTDQILRSLERVDFDSSWKQKLQQILQVADLVKFAKAQPPPDFHDRVWEDAEAFVLDTQQRPVATDGPSS